MLDLKTWCLEQHRQALLDCYLAGDNPLPPERIGHSSGKTVRWKCPVCGLAWTNSPNHMKRRSPHRSPCPYCSHERPSPFYNAALSYPELRHYWDGEQNQGGLEDYSPHSDYLAHWRCRKDHTWVRSISEQGRALKNYRKHTGRGGLRPVPHLRLQAGLPLLQPGHSVSRPVCPVGLQRQRRAEASGCSSIQQQKSILDLPL